MTSFPAETDLNNLLTRLGITTTTVAERARYLDAAIDRLETETRIRPWLAQKLTLTYHTERTRLLSRFPAYLMADNNLEVQVNSAPLSSDAYFYEADALGRIGWLAFRRPVSGMVEVTGNWGYAPAGNDAVPEDVWHAVLLEATAYALREYRPTPTEQLIESLKQGDLQIKYAQGQWVSPLSEVAGRYRRRWL